ncbi:MAG: hypothetical protein QNJ46_29060, partial [Leptolyngbyaceae cyanobacterium MO_188.B28]|nr:hypothetical protein [Leptolyngbyaceae cyanobacterium MO_188.B28]
LEGDCNLPLDMGCKLPQFFSIVAVRQSRLRLFDKIAKSLLSTRILAILKPDFHALVQNLDQTPQLIEVRTKS